MNFTIHDKDGRIIRTGFCPDGMESVQALEGELMIQVAADHNLHFVNDGLITDRPANPARFDSQTHTLSNLPNWSKVSINGKMYTCTDPTVQVEFTHVGHYRIIVEAFPYLDSLFEVDV